VWPNCSLLRTFGFFCDLSLKFIPPINIWKNCIDLRLFSKILVEPFLKPLRLRSRNFVIISKSLAANLKKVRQTSVWQTVLKFWFVWLWYLSFCITYKSKSLRHNRKDKQIRTLEPFVIQRSILLFQGWQLNFQKWLQNGLKVEAKPWIIFKIFLQHEACTKIEFFKKNPSHCRRKWTSNLLGTWIFERKQTYRGLQEDFKLDK
jgi:hypothetical protein